MKLASFLLLVCCLSGPLSFAENNSKGDTTNYGFSFGLHTGARVEFWGQQLYLQDIRFAVYKKQFSFEVGPTLGITNLKKGGAMPQQIRQVADVSGFQFSLNYSWRFSPASRLSFPTGVGMALNYRDYYKPQQTFGGSDPRTEYYIMSQNFNALELMQGIAYKFGSQWSARLDAIYSMPFAWGSTYQVLVQRPQNMQNPDLIQQAQSKVSGMFTVRLGVGFRLKYRSLGDCNCDEPPAPVLKTE